MLNGLVAHMKLKRAMLIKIPLNQRPGADEGGIVPMTAFPQRQEPHFRIASGASSCIFYRHLCALRHWMLPYGTVRSLSTISDRLWSCENVPRR
ncbi:unnamed protein product [Nezara viridula]|uniref:Uncharacterized protein n=1 Tax=Nezara viridula TaxID=85310 RepID=A0A9P0HES6_NEZVI|nr:unnamed protein product [Nezara viridula]